MNHTCVIGGGITGIAAIWELERRPDAESLDIAWLEAGDQPGGKIRTVEQDGFRFEQGPDSFISQKPWLKAWCEDLGIADQMVGCLPENNRVLFFNKGHLSPLPDGFRLCAPTRKLPLLFSPLLPLSAKFRMMWEPLIPTRSSETDESMADFVRRRFGAATLERVAGPMMAGIFVGDPEKLSIQTTFPMLVAMEEKYGSVTKGLLAATKARKNKPSEPSFMTFPRGLQQLRNEALSQISTPATTNSPVTALRREEDRWIIESATGTTEAAAVLLACPSPAAADALEAFDPELAAALREIRLVSSAALSLGFDRNDLPKKLPLDAYGVMIPQAQREHLLAVSWTSSKFSHRAPENHVLARMFVGGDGREDVLENDDDTLIERALADLNRLFGIDAQPVMRNVHRWIKASPQYEVGHREKVARIRELASKHPGLSFAGTCYDGVGLPDCVQTARTWAREWAPEHVESHA